MISYYYNSYFVGTFPIFRFRFLTFPKPSIIRLIVVNVVYQLICRYFNFYLLVIINKKKKRKSIFLNSVNVYLVNLLHFLSFNFVYINLRSTFIALIKSVYFPWIINVPIDSAGEKFCILMNRCNMSPLSI